MEKVQIFFKILKVAERAAVQYIKSSGYQCCSMCTIVGTSATISKEQKKTHTECYLPNEHSNSRTHLIFLEDAATAKYVEGEVMNINEIISPL